MKDRILIAGVGNIFLGDDAFGVEVVRLLEQREVPGGVRVLDFGIRGFDLAYALLEDWQAIIIVDAIARGASVGTLFLVEPEVDSIAAQPKEVMIDTHGMHPARVLQLAASMGEIRARVYIVGCEPADLGDELEGRMGLSEPVQIAVVQAADMVEELANRILAASNELIARGSP